MTDMRETFQVEVDEVLQLLPMPKIFALMLEPPHQLGRFLTTYTMCWNASQRLSLERCNSILGTCVNLAYCFYLEGIGRQ